MRNGKLRPEDRGVTLTTTDQHHWEIEAARAAEEKFGANTILIDVGEILSITETFVITSGASGRQVKTIADAVEERITMAGGPKPLRVEGREEYQWVLMDFGPFVVHVFDEETRSYYDLERLWADCSTIPWESAHPAS